MLNIIRDGRRINADELWAIAQTNPNLRALDDKWRKTYILTDRNNREYPVSFDNVTGVIAVQGADKSTRSAYNQIRKIAYQLNARVQDDEGNVYFEANEASGRNSKLIRLNKMKKSKPLMLNIKSMIFLSLLVLCLPLVIVFYINSTDSDLLFAADQSDSAPSAEFSQQIDELKSGLFMKSRVVNIMATNEFDSAMARRLTDKLARDTGLRVTLLEPFWLGTMVAGAGQQNHIDDLLALALDERMARGLSDASIPLIILTTVPLVDNNSSDNFNFSGASPIISTAIISIDSMKGRDFLFRKDVWGEYRMAQYMKRMVGRLLFQLPNNDDPDSYMYRRVRSVDDIDRMSVY